MKRRDFLTKSIGAGILAGSLGSLGSFRSIDNVNNEFSSSRLNRLLGSGLETKSLPFDLVAVKGGEPDAMFDRAIESLGGMKAFVQKGQTVVVKPNIGWDTTPEKGGCTNPILVKRIIEHCFKAGAKMVYVFDYTCDDWQRCYTNSGIEKVVKDAGGKMVPGNTENYYHDVKIPKGKILKNAKEHELILQSNVFINVPILKNHGGAQLTITMKNLMGIVWDRKYWHSNGLHECIADFATYRKPDLNVVDAYRVMKRNGPRGVSVDDTVLMKSLMLSTDMVTADAAACKTFGLEPKDIGHIRMAHENGAGNMNLEGLRINRIKMEA
jgi:uncharacterized protein (DUF362 family)